MLLANNNRYEELHRNKYLSIVMVSLIPNMFTLTNVVIKVAETECQKASLFVTI